MNKNDLKRILNKLTAAANPLSYDPSGADSSGLEDDACQKLRNYNYGGKILADVKKRIKSVPFTLEASLSDREAVMKIIYKHLREMIILYCACEELTIERVRLGIKPREWLLEPASHFFDQGLPIPGLTPELPLNVATSLIGLSELVIGYIFGFEPDSHSGNMFDCDHSDTLPPTILDTEAEDLGLLDDKGWIEIIWDGVSVIMVRGITSTENDPVEVTPCITVPTEQIETAFSNIPSIVTMGLVTAGVAGFAFWIRKGNFTKAMAAASAIAVASGASAAETQALNNALRGIAGPVMQQAANGQTFCPEPGTAGTSSGG